MATKKELEKKINSQKISLGMLKSHNERLRAENKRLKKRLKNRPVVHTIKKTLTDKMLSMVNNWFFRTQKKITKYL